MGGLPAKSSDARLVKHLSKTWYVGTVVLTWIPPVPRNLPYRRASKVWNHRVVHCEWSLRFILADSHLDSERDPRTETPLSSVNVHIRREAVTQTQCACLSVRRSIATAMTCHVCLTRCRPGAHRFHVKAATLLICVMSQTLTKTINCQHDSAACSLSLSPRRQQLLTARGDGSTSVRENRGAHLSSTTTPI